MIDCARHGARPGPHRHARLRRRARRRTSRDARVARAEAAAAGGVTTSSACPTPTRRSTIPAVVDFLLRRARDTAIVRILPGGGADQGPARPRDDRDRPPAARPAPSPSPTARARSRNAQVMRRALTYARDFGALIVHHCEDPDLVGDGVMNEGELATASACTGIPREAETIMLERDLRLVRLTGGRYHAAMISCARLAWTSCARAKSRRAGRHLRRLDQLAHAQRERHRRLTAPS